MLHILIIPLLLLLSPSISFATILVFNLNNNDSTVEQIHHYAQMNNEQVLVYPNNSIDSINESSMQQIIEDVKDDDIKTLIISGHYAPGSFSGKSGEIQQSAFLKNLNKYDELSSSIQNLILRGCYTTRTNEILLKSQWRSSLPNLKYISGYDGRAWSSENLYSQEFIFDALQLKQSFVNAQTPEEAVTSFKNIRHFDKSSLAIWFKTDENEYYITSETLAQNKTILNFNKIKNTCVLNMEPRLKFNGILEKYDRGEQAGFERPPADTSKGRLRKVYEWLLNNQHCVSLKIWEQNQYDDVNKAAGLLFFDRLTHNYQNIYNQNEFQQLLDEYNAVAESSLVKPDLSIASRNSIKTFVYNLSTDIYNKNNNGLAEKLNDYTITRLEYHLKGLDRLVITMDPLMLPGRWLTEDDTYVQPQFLSQPSLL